MIYLFDINKHYIKRDEIMKVEVKRIDHLGIVAGTIKDLDIVDMINKQHGGV